MSVIKLLELFETGILETVQTENEEDRLIVEGRGCYRRGYIGMDSMGIPWYGRPLRDHIPLSTVEGRSRNLETLPRIRPE